jgi:biopolymer transport protein ExbB/TolQ
MDLLAVILFFWAWWLKKQPGTPPWLKSLPWLIVIAFLVSLFGTGLGLLHAFHGVEALPPSEKSAYLAEGISRAMRFTAGAIAFDAVVLVLLIILTLTRRR